MRMTRFKWSMTRFLRLLARLLFIWPVFLLTGIPTLIFNMADGLNRHIEEWWIE